MEKPLGFVWFCSHRHEGGVTDTLGSPLGRVAGALTSAVVHPPLRSQVRDSVAARVPIDPVEAERIGVFLDHFDRLEDPFDQSLDLVHVTGSAIVVGPRGVVLLKHKRLGFWLQPGGHIDPGEAPWETALRETEEETGLTVSLVGDQPRLVHVDVHEAADRHVHLDLRYLVDGGDADPNPPPGESQDVEWLAWHAAAQRAGDARLAAALRALRPDGRGGG